MESHMQKKGHEVRLARKQRGWSAATLAQEAGVAPNTVSAIENGKPVRDGNMRKVLDALGIVPEQEAREEYPEAIELVRVMVGEALLVLPEKDRRELADAITRVVIRYGSEA